MICCQLYFGMLVGPGGLRLMGEDAKRAALGDLLSKADATSRSLSRARRTSISEERVHSRGDSKMPAAHKSLACGAGLPDSMHACGSHMIFSFDITIFTAHHGGNVPVELQITY